VYKAMHMQPIDRPEAFLFTTARRLALNQIGGDAQGMIIGLLLIGSLLVGNYWRSAQERLSRSRVLRETKG